MLVMLCFREVPAAVRERVEMFVLVVGLAADPLEPAARLRLSQGEAELRTLPVDRLSLLPALVLVLVQVAR